MCNVNWQNLKNDVRNNLINPKLSSININQQITEALNNNQLYTVLRLLNFRLNDKEFIKNNLKLIISKLKKCSFTKQVQKESNEYKYILLLIAQLINKHQFKDLTIINDFIKLNKYTYWTNYKFQYHILPLNQIKSLIEDNRLLLKIFIINLFNKNEKEYLLRSFKELIDNYQSFSKREQLFINEQIIKYLRNFKQEFDNNWEKTDSNLSQILLNLKDDDLKSRLILAFI